MKIALIVPTYNAGYLWNTWLDKLSLLSMPKPDQVLIIDSSSRDQTVSLAEKAGLDTVIIPSLEFNHGGTRNRAASLVKQADILVFMTQDALFANPQSLEMLVSYFSDPKVAAVCGRQLPHDSANPLACHARFFNYGERSFVRTLDDIPKYGIKTAFMSNSFAAYRASVFHELGGFPESTILAEDMYLTAKMLLAGYKVAYSAEAMVQHSHNYSPWDEFRRYFDIGVFHACQPWIRDTFGGAGGEGMRYVKSELAYLFKNGPLWIPRALVTTAAKLFGYKLGQQWKKLPLSWCRYFSMYKSYWSQKS